MNKDVKKRVFEIVKKISGTRVENIDLRGNLKDALTLDSIQVVELFAALENEFNIELPLSMMMVKSASEFFDQLEQVLDAKKVAV